MPAPNYFSKLWGTPRAFWDDDIFYGESLEVFPDFKPDVDVFVHRTPLRRQKGWYQVTHGTPHHPPPPQSENSDLYPPCAQHKPVTAGDMPLEIMHAIFDAVESCWQWRTMLMSSSTEFAAYALVCRFWAKAFQKKLFLSVQINSRQRCEEFLGFLRSSHSQIPKLVKYVSLKQQRSELPWIPLFTTHVKPLLMETKLRVSLSVDGQRLSGGDGALRQRNPLPAILPKSLPSLSAHISTVTLKSIEFEDFEEIVQIFAELPSLHIFEGKRITWNRASTRSPPTRMRSDNKLFFAQFTDCTDNWAVTCVTCNRVLPGERELQARDFAQLAVLTNLTEKGLRSTEGVFFRAAESVRSANDMCFEVGFQGINHNIMIMKVHASAPSENDSMLSIVELEVTCYRPRDWGVLDWHAFDAAATAFPNLEKVTMVFGDRYKEADVVEKTIEQLTQMSRKKTFVVKFEKRQDWYY